MREELGVDLAVGRLLCVDYRSAIDGVRSDALRFVFDGGELTAADTDCFVLDAEELLGWRFVDAAHLDAYVIPVLARRIRACLATSEGVFMEEGVPAPLADMDTLNSTRRRRSSHARGSSGVRAAERDGRPSFQSDASPT